jgi:hypothetical protein
MGINLAPRINDMLSLKVNNILDRQGNIIDYINIKEQKTKKEIRLRFTKRLNINLIISLKKKLL